MGEVDIESHNMGPTFYRLTSLWFHVNRPSHSWDTTFSKFDLENPRASPWGKWANDHDSALGKPMGQMGKWPWQCTTTGLDNSTELRMEKIRQAVTEIWVPQVWQPPARPPARTVTTIPLQPEGLRGKKVWRTDGQTDWTIHRAALSQLKRCDRQTDKRMDRRTEPFIELLGRS